MYKSREIMIDTTQELVVSQTKRFNRSLLKTFPPSPSQKKVLKKKQETNLLGWKKVQWRVASPT